MRLVKLIAYSLLGYVLYELYLGMTEGGAQTSSSTAGPEKVASSRSGEQTVAVEDANGAKIKRKVGRGVVH